MNDSITRVKYLLQAWLGSDAFGAELDAINAELHDVVIPRPAIIYPYERVVPPEKFPSAELLGLNSLPNGDSSAQMYQHNIDVLWTHVGSDQEALVMMVEGLVLATRRLTFRATLLMPDGSGAPIIPGMENYGPMIQRQRGQQQPLVKGATIRLQVPTFAGEY